MQTSSYSYPVMYPFPLFIALRNHNPQSQQTDGRTGDVRHACSISVLKIE